MNQHLKPDSPGAVFVGTVVAKWLSAQDEDTCNKVEASHGDFRIHSAGIGFLAVTTSFGPRSAPGATSTGRPGGPVGAFHPGRGHGRAARVPAFREFPAGVPAGLAGRRHSNRTGGRVW